MNTLKGQPSKMSKDHWGANQSTLECTKTHYQSLSQKSTFDLTQSIETILVCQIALDIVRPFATQYHKYFKKSNKRISTKKAIYNALVVLQIQLDEGDTKLDDNGHVIGKDNITS